MGPSQLRVGTRRVDQEQHSYRLLNGGSTYAVFNEKTETVEWEEKLKIDFWALSVSFHPTIYRGSTPRPSSLISEP